MSNTYGGPTRMPSLTELADLEDQDVQFDNIIHRYQVCSREIQVLANAVQTRPVPVRRQHKCVFRACKAVEAQYDKITFHNIPQLVGPIRDAWIKAVRKSLNNPTWMPKKGEKVCSLHFDPKDILSPHEKTFIRREAFPTRFLESVIDNDKESMEQKIDIAAGGAKISSVRVQTVGDRISPLQNTGCASGLSERMKRKLLRNIRADRTFIHDSETRESAQRRLAKVAKEAKRLKDVIKNLNRNLFLKNVKMKELRMEMSRTKSNFRKQNIGSIISMADSQLVPKLSKTFQKLWKKEVHGRFGIVSKKRISTNRITTANVLPYHSTKIPQSHVEEEVILIGSPSPSRSPPIFDERNTIPSFPSKMEFSSGSLLHSQVPETTNRIDYSQVSISNEDQILETNPTDHTGITPEIIWI